MRKNLRILLSLILVIAMSFSINAANFKDVPDNEWYAQYVNKAASAGIIKGYDDNTFRPKGNISFTEISSLLGNLVNVSEAQMQTANSTYGKQLDALLNQVKKQGNKGIDWARPAILKCLQAGVYDLTTLTGAVNGKMLLDTNPSKRPPVSRSNTASFFADALKLNVAAASLPYKDTAKIPANIQTKVQALINIGVLSKDGDGNGYFNPTDPIDRASIAKMITVAMDYIAKNSNSNNNSNNNPISVIPTPTTIKNIKGKVTAVDMQSSQAIVLVNNGSSGQAVYVNFETVVNVDGSLSLFNKIEEGMTADITYNTGNGIATKADFKSEETVIEGKISYVHSTYRFEVEYVKGSIVNNKIDLDFRDADITLDGRKANVSDLETNFEVKITMVGSKVKKVEAKKGNAYSDGTFFQFGYSKEDYYYYVDLYPNNSNNRSSVKIAGNSVYINNKNVDCRDLTNSYYRNKYILEGTPIKLKTNSYNEVTDITTVFAEIRDGVIQGYIYRTPRRNDSSIRLAPNTNSYDRDTIDLKVDSNTKYYFSNSSSSRNIEDLREKDFVKITMRNGSVDKVEVDRNGNGWGNNNNVDFGTGTIYSVGNRNDELKIYCDSNQNPEISSKSITFRVNSNTNYWDGRGPVSAQDFWYYIRGYNGGSNNARVDFKWYKNRSNYYITEIKLID